VFFGGFLSVLEKHNCSIRSVQLVDGSHLGASENATKNPKIPKIVIFCGK
jgi:hypothetical protein